MMNSKSTYKARHKSGVLRVLLFITLATLTTSHVTRETVEEDTFTLLLTETFETEGNGTRYRANTFNDPPGDVWLRWDLASFPAGPNATTTSSGRNFFQAYTGQQGSYAFGGEDMDDSDNPLGTGKPGYITFQTLDVSAYQGGTARVEALLGGSTELNSRYETGDYFTIEYAFDDDISDGASNTGDVPEQADLETGTYTIGGAFLGGAGSGGAASNLTEDTDLDGSPNAGASTLSPALSDHSFEFSIPATASKMSVRIVALGGSAEEMVVDNVRISAEAGGSATPTIATVAATAFIEGAWDGTSAMKTLLKSGGLMSLTAPYDTVNNHNGSESVTGDSDIPADVVDWVLVELREADSPGDANDDSRVGSAAGFLKSNGQIVATDGSSDLTISLSGNTGVEFFVVVYHRNHLPIMSLSKVSEVGGKYTIDLSASGNVYEAGDAVTTLSSSSKVGMHAGDLDQDGSIGNSDLNTWRSSNGVVYSYASSGKADFNLDGVINAVDRNDFHQKNTAKTRRVPK